MALFIPGEWAIDRGDPNTYSDYQIFRDSVGYWNAPEKIDLLRSHKISKFDDLATVPALAGRTYFPHDRQTPPST